MTKIKQLGKPQNNYQGDNLNLSDERTTYYNSSNYGRGDNVGRNRVGDKSGSKTEYKKIYVFINFDTMRRLYIMFPILLLHLRL